MAQSNFKAICKTHQSRNWLFLKHFHVIIIPVATCNSAVSAVLRQPTPEMERCNDDNSKDVGHSRGFAYVGLATTTLNKLQTYRRRTSIREAREIRQVFGRRAGLLVG